MNEMELLGIFRTVSFIALAVTFFIYAGMFSRIYRITALVATFALVVISTFISDGFYTSVAIASVLMLIPLVLSPFIHAVMRLKLRSVEKKYGKGSTGISIKFSWLSVYQSL